MVSWKSNPDAPQFLESRLRSGPKTGERSKGSLDANLKLPLKDWQTPNMHWLTPAVETNVAYVACVVLFGLLVLSVRNRKMAARSTYSLSGSASHGARVPAKKNLAAERLRRASAPIQSSGRFLSTGLEYTPRERANPQVADSPLTKLPPLDFPAPHNPNEVKMDTPPFLLESSVETIAAPENSVLAAAAAASATPAIVPSVPAPPVTHGFS